MVFWNWLVREWFTLLQSAGIVGGLLFTAFSMREENKTRRIGNVLAVTHNHREIWTEIFHRPELRRVLHSDVDLEKFPISEEEQIFVNFVILHLNSVFDAMKEKLVLRPEGLRKDVGRFFALPIPRAVWNQMKPLHEEEFVRFVESCWLEN